jgi:hypothetical protein
MIDYIKAVRSLLPSGQAFDTYGDKVNAKFFKGLFSWIPAQLDFVQEISLRQRGVALSVDKILHI